MYSRCIACEHYGTPVLLVHRPGFKIKPSFYAPLCEKHRDGYAERGLSVLHHKSSKVRMRLAELGWIKTGGKYSRPSSEFELE